MEYIYMYFMRKAALAKILNIFFWEYRVCLYIFKKRFFHGEYNL